MPTLHIQGIDAEYRDLFPDEEILYKNLPQKEQKFKRPDIPFTDDDLVAIANNEHSYTELQKKWVAKEEWRIDNGVYAMINGVLTFIPGSVYGYVCYWTLENGKKPDYRNCTRKIFILKEYLCFKTPVLALTRGKSRRKGATSEGTFWEWWICGRKEEKIGGMVSYNTESASKIFQMLFMRGFKSIIPCFVREFDSNSENFIRFVKPVEKKKKGVPIKREGLNSYIDYQPTTVNSYDSGRVSYLLLDEFGKWEKVDINTYWSKVKPTLTEGSKKVGFSYIPTTVNPKNKGGENYRIFWEEANQEAINPKTNKPYGINTPSRVVRIFDPATEGYEGCIDEFGESVIEDPVEPIMGNDGEWITEGSLTKIRREREGLEGIRLMEHRRDYPIDVFDLFAFETGSCEFNEERLIAQLRWLEENPVYLRRVRLYREKVTKKNIFTERDETFDEVRYMDDNAGEWLLFEKPMKENLYDHHGLFKPLNEIRYSIGVDTIKSGFTINGSTATICVFKKSHIIEGKETGLYPVAIYMGKPRLMQHLYEQVLMACLWYGCRVNFEIDAGTAFYDYFLSKDSQKFLEWTPRIAVDVTKKQMKIKPGTESANPFQFAMQLEVAKKYFDGTQTDGYNGNVHRVVFPILLNQALEYNHSDRTKSDVVISLMMALLPCFGSTDVIYEPEYKRPKILPQFKIKMVG
jgi:hypothetical protein